MLRGILPRSTYRPFTTLGLLLALTAPFASSNELQEISSPCYTSLAESSEELSQPTCIPNDYLSGSVQTVFSSAPQGVSLKLHEKASLPVQNSTKSFWLDTPGANPLAEEGSNGELTRDADVCIIGSGITGVSTAWHLSKMLNGRNSEGDSSVVILEARRFCSGATGRNGGHLTRNPFLSFLHRQAAYNASEAVKSFLIEDYSTSSLVNFIHEHGIENAVDFVREGLVTVFHTKDEETRARNDWAAAKEAGLDAEVTWLDNADLVEQYGLNPKLNYTALSTPDAHNLWPCKLVTQLLEDSQTSSDVRISLHTNTPVTTITRNYWPFDHQNQGEDENTASSGSSWSTTQHRRWKLHTPRGTIGCSYVVHATNGYASHLLPFLAGIDESESESESRLTSPSRLSPTDSDAARGGGRPPPEEEHPLPEPQPPHPHPSPPPLPPSRGAYGIIPTRGQVGAVRASVPPAEFKWRNAWDGGGGWEYFFPRFQDTYDEEANTTKNPLVILGGERQHSGGSLEAGVADDSSLNPRVSTALRAFLPHFFPGQFGLPAAEDTGSSRAATLNDGWEMEWTGIMAFTKDGDPLVGPVTVPEELQTSGEVNAQADYYEGQYISAGYSGHGMPRAFACAEVIAGMIKARITGEEWTKPEWLPEHYLTWARRT